MKSSKLDSIAAALSQEEGFLLSSKGLAIPTTCRGARDELSAGHVVQMEVDGGIPKAAARHTTSSKKLQKH